jgi:hypothetical protein
MASVGITTMRVTCLQAQGSVLGEDWVGSDTSVNLRRVAMSIMLRPLGEASSI